uniref:Type I phosphodiesterase/nucleotide pyrophosphatase n=1 Tax=Solibacter usitatus (strain Ellin6076) TaxID=234267 RepID=Q01YA1_SOLUE
MAICRREFTLGILAGTALSPLKALAPRPKLLVLVLLEQLRSDHLDAFSSQFGDKGLKKILSKGAHFPDCRHLASTFSSSSIATLATGAWPAQHGIVADNWFDTRARASAAASDEALLSGTLCAQIEEAEPTRTFVIGMDAAQTALFAGNPQTQQFWMDSDGRFTTLGETPDWLVQANNLKPVENAHNAAWMAIDARTGAPPLRTMRFDAAHPAEFRRLYGASPFGQQAQFELLRELIEKENLGQNGSFDFVCLIASAAANLGFEVGGGDPLMRQMVLQLDRHLGFLLEQLNNSPGENNFTLVLAAGHGIPNAPADMSRPRMAVEGESVAQAVNRALIAADAGRVARYIYPFLYLDTSGFRDPEPLRMLAARAAMSHPAVAACYTAGGYCTVRDSFEQRFRNSFHSQRSGDVMLSYHPGYVEDFGQGRGISYGSLYNYDVRVPLCFYGPQFRAGVFESPVQSVDLAPTLARATGMATPESSVGQVLGEAFA